MSTVQIHHTKWAIVLITRIAPSVKEEEITNYVAHLGARSTLRSGSMSERLGCPIRPTGGSAVRRPDGFVRKAIEKKAKVDGTSHLWNLSRIIQCLRFCEMQWGFVNAHVESRIRDHKQVVCPSFLLSDIFALVVCCFCR